LRDRRSKKNTRRRKRKERSQIQAWGRTRKGSLSTINVAIRAKVNEVETKQVGGQANIEISGNLFARVENH